MIFSKDSVVGKFTVSVTVEYLLGWGGTGDENWVVYLHEKRNRFTGKVKRYLKSPVADKYHLQDLLKCSVEMQEWVSGGELPKFVESPKG